MVEELGKMGGEEAVAALTHILEVEDESNFTRRCAIKGLRKIGGSKAIAPLTRALEDKDDEVAHVAGHGLGDIGGSEVIAALTHALENVENQYRMAWFKPR